MLNDKSGVWLVQHCKLAFGVVSFRVFTRTGYLQYFHITHVCIFREKKTKYHY